MRRLEIYDLNLGSGQILINKANFEMSLQLCARSGLKASFQSALPAPLIWIAPRH